MEVAAPACLTGSNKKLVGTSATLVVTSAIDVYRCHRGCFFPLCAVKDGTGPAGSWDLRLARLMEC